VLLSLTLARRAGVYLVAGVQLNRARGKDNASWLFGPAGELLAEYRKQHIVPYLESDLTPGSEEVVRTLDGAPFGLAICRDLIFTAFGRRHGRHNRTTELRDLHVVSVFLP
jgi:predicted amidohydrolase